jgi:hypothetical protein
MQAQREAPPDMQCKDKFLVQSVIVAESTSSRDVTGEMVVHLTSLCLWAFLWMFISTVLMTKPCAVY